MKKSLLALLPIFLSANIAMADDWNGLYGALGVSHQDVSVGDIKINVGDDTLFSIIGGTRTTLDNGLVLGLEADYSNTSFASDYLGSLRAVGGLQVFDGKGLLFATAGYAHPNHPAFEGGFAIGAGYEMQMSDKINLRADVINHRVGIDSADVDLDGSKVDMLSVRAAVSYQF